MKTTWRLFLLEIWRIPQSCGCGLQRWKEVVAPLLLLALLSVLVLNNDAADVLLLHVLRWLGQDCHWCSIKPG